MNNALFSLAGTWKVRLADGSRREMTLPGTLDENRIGSRDAGANQWHADDASGNGGIDYDSAEKWLPMIERDHIPYVVWNLSNKNESSAVIRPECTKLSDWSDSELSDTGKWFRSRMQKERGE